MKLPLPPVLLAFLSLALLLVLAVVAMRRSKGAGRGGAIALKGRALMNERERAMYQRLKETFPGSVVLGQVAFSALVASTREHRHRFDRLVADFVLCDASMKVQVVIELSDPGNKNRARLDAVRSKVLAKAGYKVLRFANVPGQDDLRAYLNAQMPADDRAASPRRTTSRSAVVKATRSMALDEI
jgi:very-short-patch-repair endonuclease